MPGIELSGIFSTSISCSRYNKGTTAFFIKEMSPTINESWLIRMSQTCEVINRPLLVLASACDVVSGDSYAHIQERNVIVTVKNFWNCWGLDWYCVEQLLDKQVLIFVANFVANYYLYASYGNRVLKHFHVAQTTCITI